MTHGLVHNRYASRSRGLPTKVHMTEHYERRRILAPSTCEAESFRTHDIGRPGGGRRIAWTDNGAGKWVTQALLIGRDEPESMKIKLRNQARLLRARYVRQARSA